MSVDDNEFDFLNEEDSNEGHAGKCNHESQHTLSEGQLRFLKILFAITVMQLIMLVDLVVKTMVRTDLEEDVATSSQYLWLQVRG